MLLERADPHHISKHIVHAAPKIYKILGKNVIRGARVITSTQQKGVNQILYIQDVSFTVIHMLNMFFSILMKHAAFRLNYWLILSVSYGKAMHWI